MRKVMILMNISMGFTVSLVLSLVGTLMGGHFTVPSWLISFAISFVLSLIIGFLVPMKKIGDAACGKCNIVPESLKGNLLNSLISDLIYTPIITIIMVVTMVGNAAKRMQAAGITQGVPSVARVLPGSLVVSLLVAYVVIFVAQPLFIKLYTRR